MPDNYHLHLCGFGRAGDVEAIKRQVSAAQSKSKAIITYDGLKKGEEFIQFLQQCHIGLSTQTPVGEYNDTSFPSKVLSYMANGLSVVSICIPVLQKSALSNSISFYNMQDGKELAQAIINCDYRLSYRELVQGLNDTFVKKLNDLIKHSN